MVARGPKDRPDLAALAPLTLKPLRQRRGVQKAEIADALGITPRAVENFENGKGALNVERVHKVAALLRVDPHAILAAFEIGSPAFAQRCADNMFMLIFMMRLQAFDAKVGDAIGLLDPHTVMKACDAFFDDLANTAAEQESIVSRWKGGDGGEGGSEPGSSEPDTER